MLTVPGCGAGPAYAAPHAEVARAKIVLLATDGLESTVIAAGLDVHVGVVSWWRGRATRSPRLGCRGQRG